MRACEADRCEAGATVGGRWCERHAPADERPVYPVRIEYDEEGEAFVPPLVGDPPEYAPDAPTVEDHAWVERWLHNRGALDAAESKLATLRAERVKILAAMRESGMSLGDIAEVTGLTRQRVGQLLR